MTLFVIELGKIERAKMVPISSSSFLKAPPSLQKSSNPHLIRTPWLRKYEIACLKKYISKFPETEKNKGEARCNIRQCNI